MQRFRHKSIPEDWRSKQEKALAQKKKVRRMVTGDDGQTFVDFGVIEDGTFKNKNIRVKACGKTIWNYPSDKAIARAGWLHYSIIAKGSKLFDAIELCHNWVIIAFVSRLSSNRKLTIPFCAAGRVLGPHTLAIFSYFPTPTWSQWAGNREEMLQLGFIPYVKKENADKLTMNDDVPDSGRRGGKIHVEIQLRNVCGAHIKRNDPVSRRLVRYLAMQAQELVLLVRDSKTGPVLIKPPTEECWLIRGRAGYPSYMAGEDLEEWHVVKSVDQNLFEEVSGKQTREWQFGFAEYYDTSCGIWSQVSHMRECTTLSKSNSSRRIGL